ncbi:MAG: hypothetical protein D6689_03750, partial [Deltaproteobacteria bacterium]
MDVRCEKCGTDYEFDEAKLKPGGVTVKCAECGHMFRVRRRTTTNVGARGAPPVPRATPSASSGSTTASTAVTAVSGAGQRVWLIRDEQGRVQTCRELATLQQWVVAGRVTRECEISRTGKSWKKLGSIAELGAFFRIAEEARRRAAAAANSAPVAAADSAPVAAADSAPVAASAGATPRAAAPESTAPLPGPTRPPAAGSGPAQPSPAAGVPADQALRSAAAPAAQPASAGMTGPDAAGRSPIAPANGEGAAAGDAAWAAADAAPKLAIDPAVAGPTGPVGGLARGLPTSEAAFAGGATKAPRIDDIMPAQFEPIDAYDDDELRPPRSGIGKWIALVSLVVLAGAAAAVYALVLRPPAGASRETLSTPLDAAVAATGESGEAAAREPAAGAPSADDVLKSVEADLRADTAAALDAASARLDALAAADPAASARIAIARARILEARAQHALDDGGPGSAATAKQLADRAAQVAADVLARDAANLTAKIALADAMRLQGARTRDVDHHIRDVLAARPRDPEALYVRALLRERDGKLDAARALYGELAANDGDVRPLYRLARIALAAGDAAAAAELAARVLSVQPEHRGALAIRDRAAAATTAGAAAAPASQSKPAGDGRSGGDGERGGDGQRTGEIAAGGRERDYDALIDKADRLAENGKCAAAME